MCIWVGTRTVEVLAPRPVGWMSRGRLSVKEKWRAHMSCLSKATRSDLKFRIAGILHDTKSIAVDVLQASRQNERPGVVQL